MGNRPVTLDHLKTSKKPVIRKVWIALDDEVAEEFQEAISKRDSLKSIHRVRPDDKTIASDLHVAEQACKEAEAKFRESAALFKFKSIGRVAFDKMIKNHPPTAEEKREVAEAGGDPSELQWCVETFSVALTAACSLEPKMTVAEVQELWDDDNWTQAEAAAMFNAALQANMERRNINLDAVGNGSRGTNGSKQN